MTNFLSKNEVIFADGATGTNSFEKGLETGYPPELWNVEHPKQIKSVHCEFIKAGSDMILTNSFGGTSFRLKLHQSENRVAELNSTAAQLARQEADKPVIVAGSVGPAELIHSISHFDGYTEGKLIIAKSNCGIPTYDNGQIRYKGTPELMVV